jgi:hypothetical protein
LRQIEAPDDAHRRRRAAAQFRRNPVQFGVVRRLSVTVGGRGVEGKEVGEEARCTGACERKMAKQGTALGDAFLWQFGDAVGRKRAGGPTGCLVGAREERRGRGRGAAPREPARARRLRTTRTAAGSARRAGARDAREQGRRRARATLGQRLTSGA